MQWVVLKQTLNQNQTGKKVCFQFLFLSLVIGCFVVEKLKQFEPCFLSLLHVMYIEISLIVYIERICECPD